MLACYSYHWWLSVVFIMRAYLKDNQIRLKFDYDQAVLQYIRKIDGRVFSKGTKEWILSINTGEHHLRNLEKLGFEVDPAVFEAIESRRSLDKELQGLEGRLDTDISTSINLWPYQRVGAAWLARAGGGIQGDPVRSGKTYMTLAALEHLGSERVLIITPTTPLYGWMDKINELLPTWKTLVATGPKKERLKIYEEARTGAVALIMTYDIARIDYDILKDFPTWDDVVCDEAHNRMSNVRTKTRRAIKQYKSKRRYCLSATPIQNSAPDAYGLADFCFPGCFGRYKDFCSRYTVQNKWGGIWKTVNTVELAGKLRRYMIRRELKDIWTEMPPITIDNLVFDLSEKERKLYDQIQAELLFDIEKQHISKIESPVMIQQTLTKCLRLLEVCDSMELLGEDKTSTKLNILRERLADCLLNGDKAIVFTRFKRMAVILARELANYNPLLISGDVVGDKRAEAINKFREDPAHKVLISTDAGGEGVSYAAANFTFNYDLPYSYSKYEQRNGRMVLKDKTAPMAVFDLVARNSIDEKVARIIAKKKNLFDALLGTDVKEFLT